MDDILQNEDAKDHFQKVAVEFHGDYFVSSPIWHVESFQEALETRKGKPFYIPAKKELLKYQDEDYFPVTRVKEYNGHTPLEMMAYGYEDVL